MTRDGSRTPRAALSSPLPDGPLVWRARARPRPRPAGARTPTPRVSAFTPARRSRSAGPASAPAGSPTRLFVLVHGLGGTPEDLTCLERNILLGARREGVAALVLKPGCNVLARSFDGVRAGATRVADEIRAVVAAHPTLVDVSLVGNSLGGLYARYAAALLFDVRAGTIAGLRPDAFLTTATRTSAWVPSGTSVCSRRRCARSSAPRSARRRGS